jgi:hypothetical protein|tara:strand:- start:62 stop:796 length:735 start_codon:yes stop_codon:yes gene_type:complete
MKDNLTDLVNHTHVLGNVSFVKIVGTDKETEFQSVADDKSVIIQGKFKNVIPEFNGVFGMPNLTKLNIILNIPEYDTDASIVVNTQTKNGETVPSGLRFENKASDFRNDYRFMSTEIVNEKLKDLKAKTSIKWNVSVQPSVANIQRFKFQSQANTEEPVFVAKTDGSKLKFHFGDPSSMNGEFVFDNGISGALTKAWQFPVAPVISILNLLGDKTLQISDQGALQIIVDSGTAEYTYTLPAQVK